MLLALKVEKGLSGDLKNFFWLLPHTLGAPLVTGNSQENASNHQIVLCPPFKKATPSFPIVECFISTSHGTLGHSLEAFGDPQGLLEAPLCLKMAKKCFKLLDISLSTFRINNTLFSHS